MSKMSEAYDIQEHAEEYAYRVLGWSTEKAERYADWFMNEFDYGDSLTSDVTHERETERFAEAQKRPVKELYEQYDAGLDSEGPVSVGGLEFDVSRALRELDPIGYRTGFNDWLDSNGIDGDTDVNWEDDDR